MNIPGDLKYTEDHEWVRVEGSVGYVGITDHAQHELGDIVYVELPEVDMEVEKDEEATSIESVKAAAPVNSPLSGKIVQVNEDLEDEAELINKDPYEAYIFAVEMSDTSELDDLMDADAYKEFLEK
ncbi:MAG: glycine cleavage system protein GcvH [Spirochaetes bacterium]|nr:MAG: glycine cleavage system protein GcvH [Spirochaetota bacterium]